MFHTVFRGLFLVRAALPILTVHAPLEIAEYMEEDGAREEVFMEGPLEPNMGPSLADVLLCTFESTNAGFSSFPLRKPLSWE
jgi:hypothetical protein